MISTTRCYLALIVLILCFGAGRAPAQQSKLPPCPNVSVANYNNCFSANTFDKGIKYVGEWKNGLPNGHWTLTLPDGEKYVGEYKDGQRSGHGILTFKDGSQYVGEFKDSKFSGHGTFKFSNGEIYTGEFKNGQRDGHGTDVLATGIKHYGQFKNGQRSGRGILYAADGSVISQGIFANDVIVKSAKPGMMRERASPSKTSGNSHRVQMVKEGGTYTVPVLINDVLMLHFVVDSGAADVTIPADVALTLIRTGTIKEGDFIGSQKYQLADGSIIDSAQFTIRSLKVGDQIIENVRGSIGDLKGSLLLGQSFLEKFKSWSMDNATHELVLE